MFRMEKSPYLWTNGKLVAWDEVTFHITELGRTSISTVFEGIKGYWNNDEQELYLFRLDEHLRRLAQSMKLLRMKPQSSTEQWREAILHLLRANGTRQDIYVCPLAYQRAQGPGLPTPSDAPPEVTIYSVPFSSHLTTGKAITCGVSSWTRIADYVMPPRIKSVANYYNGRLAKTEAWLHGYDDAILLNDRGKVAEAPGACLFIVRDGVAITPAVTESILESITRATVLQLCRELLHMPVEERGVDRTELYVADEAFMCGTGLEITPIVSIDRHALGSGEIGPVTRTLDRLYHDLVRGLDKRYEPWRTPVWMERQ